VLGIARARHRFAVDAVEHLLDGLDVAALSTSLRAISRSWSGLADSGVYS
jgi:hypothetical protein